MPYNSYEILENDDDTKQGIFSRFFATGVGAHEFYWTRDGDGNDLVDYYHSMIDSVARGSEIETGDSSLKEYSNVSLRAPQTQEEKKKVLKEHKMFNALYKSMLQKNDKVKPLHYLAGISVGGYLIDACKEEALNLIVIDSGIL
jgi:hypothetical protein